LTITDWLGEDNKLGIRIWENKYRQNNESFEHWLDRVSGGDKTVRKLIAEKKFLFGGRILSYRGLAKDGAKVSLSNCYVLSPPDDSIEGIFEASKKLARTLSYGGGVGIDVSKLAPRGAKVNNAAKTTSGAVSFMDLYNLTTDLIGQEGRRGALMLSIACSHPDIMEFIDVKSDLTKINKANISIRITDEFMRAVKNRESYELTFTREQTGETVAKNVDAFELFHKLAEMNWNYAEPGVLFWDNIEGYSLLSDHPDFKFAGVNPCGEEPLPEGGSCLLGSINLSAFAVDGDFDFESFRRAVDIAVGALNDVLDEGLPLHPLQEQRDSVRDWRQIGLGICGLADCLIKLKMVYGSDESIEFCNLMGYAMTHQAILTSALLAKAYGAYPKYDRRVIDSDFFVNHEFTDIVGLVEAYGLRNSQLLTCAPTGSISTMIGVSGGLEPIFANYYTRKTQSLHGKDVEYKVYTPIVEKYMKEHGITDDADLPGYFVCSHQIHYMDRINMQSVWQKHIDASISSTVNLPNNATIEDVEKVYMEAWSKGLKGITVYRDGCARSGILTTESKKSVTQEQHDKDSTCVPELGYGTVLQVDDDVVGKKRKLMTGCGSMHVVAFFDPISGQLLETYLSKGSTGGCNNFMIGLSRLISLSARAGCDVYTIADQLASCGVCPSYAVRTATKKDTSQGSCCPVAIGRALIAMHEEFISEICADEDESPTVVTSKTVQSVAKSTSCPECGEPTMAHENGCVICKSCGWTKCS